jgi:hypothetical protein
MSSSQDNNDILVDDTTKMINNDRVNILHIYDQKIIKINKLNNQYIFSLINNILNYNILNDYHDNTISRVFCSNTVIHNLTYLKKIINAKNEYIFTEDCELYKFIYSIGDEYCIEFIMRAKFNKDYLEKIIDEIIKDNFKTLVIILLLTNIVNINYIKFLSLENFYGYFYFKYLEDIHNKIKNNIKFELNDLLFINLVNVIYERYDKKNKYKISSKQNFINYLKCSSILMDDDDEYYNDNHYIELCKIIENSIIDDYNALQLEDVNSNSEITQINNIYNDINDYINNNGYIINNINIINEILKDYKIEKTITQQKLLTINDKLNSLISNTNYKDMLKYFIRSKDIYNITYIEQLYYIITDIDIKFKLLKHLIYSKLDNMIEINESMIKNIIESIFSYELITLYITNCNNINVDFILNVIETYPNKFTTNEFNNMLLINNIDNIVNLKIKIKINKILNLIELL